MFLCSRKMEQVTGLHVVEVVSPSLKNKSWKMKVKSVLHSNAF